MPIGSDLKKSVAAAKKEGIDVSGMAGIDGYCKTIDELEKMIASLAKGIKDVEKYGKTPTKALAKDVKAYFSEQKEFIDGWKKIAKDHDAYRTVLTATQKGKPAKDMPGSIGAALVYCNQIEQVFGKSPFLEDSTKTIKELNKFIDDKKKEDLKKFEADQKKREEEYMKLAEAEAEELYIRA